ncbi:MAG: 30S ribosomal protein S8 [Proteobacteria bacterium]|nr:30S ribosomal protein S8 [Pseudomonadota bacterium]
MTMSDPISDMLARIRNAQRAGHATVEVPVSGHKGAILDVLYREGYLRGFKKDGLIYKVELKYENGKPMIHEVHRISRPGRRVYSAKSDLPRFYNGLGIAIISTSRGVMSDHEARNQNIGGEILCQVF